MAFTPSDGSGGSGTTAIGSNLASAFGSTAQKSAAVKSAESFRDAAKAGQFRIDPDQAKSAIKDLMRAEDAITGVRQRAAGLAQRPSIGGSPYAYKAAGWYGEGGESCRDAVDAFAEVLKATREVYEFAVKNYARMDAESSQTFNKGM